LNRPKKEKENLPLKEKKLHMRKKQLDSSGKLHV
jgi:hypothetical protein